MLSPPKEAGSPRAALPARRSARAVLALLTLVLAAVAVPAPPAAAARFTLETDHFYVHFDGGYEGLAREAAAVAEDVHRELAPRVGHVPSEKTHLILLDVTDMANGYTDPMLYPKVVVFPVYPTFFSPYGSGISPRLHEWMRFVILHEYTHALHLDMNEGVGKALATLFGRVPILTTPMLDQSYAFIEGFATYQETVAGLGGRGHDPYYAMFLRAMVLEGDVLHLDQILGHYPLERWKPGAVVYLYGYALWEYMADRYGDDVLERFNRVFASTRLLDVTFHQVLGVTPERFYRDWEAQLTRTHRARIRELQAEGITPAHPLGGEGYVPESPVASPDGRRVAYATINGPVAPALRLLDLGRPGAPRDRQLLAGVVLGPVAWSPDGETLYYARMDAEGGRTLTDLYAYDLSTGRERRLTRGLRAFGPAVSPDGRRLVFTRRGDLSTRLLELDLTGRLPAEPDSPALRELVPAQGERQLLASGWAPDGSWILVNSHETGGGSDLLRLDPASGKLEPLVVGSRARGGEGVVNENAQFAPDGRFILFDSDRTGVYALYAYELASGRVLQVARTLTGLFDPTVVGYDGEPSLVAMEYTARGYRLSRLTYDPSGWEPVPLPAPRTAVALSAPDPSPDGAGDTSLRPSPRTEAPPTEVLQGHVRPYRPWSSLRPRFWLPLIGMDEAGPQLGALTFGYDAYQERSYALMAGYGISSGRPTFLADYAGPLLGNTQAFWGIGGGQQTLLEPEGAGGTVRRDLYLDAGYSWPGILAATALTARAEVWEEQPVSDDGSPGPWEPGQALSVGASRVRSWPVDDRSFDLESGVTVTGLRSWGDEPREGVRTTLRERAALNWDLGRRTLDADLALGTSSLPGGFTVGTPADWLRGTDGAWSLNTAGPELEGRHAARLTLGVGSQLLRISRGMGTTPFFFDDVGGRLYMEGGAVWASLDEAPRARYGVGAEASLTTYVEYAIPLTLSVGVAVPVDDPDGSTSVYVRLDVSDLLGAASGLLRGGTRAGETRLPAAASSRP